MLVTRDTPLYQTKRLRRVKLQVIRNSKVEVLQRDGELLRVRISYEPELNGRRNRQGSLGWVRSNHVRQIAT